MEITCQYLCHLPYLRYLKKFDLNRSSSILHPITFFLRVNTGSAKTFYRTTCPWIYRYNEIRNGPKENSLFDFPGPFKGIWYTKPWYFINETSVLWHTRHSLKLVSELFNKTFTICSVQWYFIIYKINRDRCSTGINTWPPCFLLFTWIIFIPWAINLALYYMLMIQH